MLVHELVDAREVVVVQVLHTRQHCVEAVRVARVDEVDDVLRLRRRRHVLTSGPPLRVLRVHDARGGIEPAGSNLVRTGAHRDVRAVGRQLSRRLDRARLRRADHRQVPHQVLPLDEIGRPLEADDDPVPVDVDVLHVDPEVVPVGRLEAAEIEVERDVLPAERLPVRPLDAGPDDDRVLLLARPLGRLRQPVDVLPLQRIEAEQRLVDEPHHAGGVVAGIRVRAGDVAPLRAARDQRLRARISRRRRLAAARGCCAEDGRGNRNQRDAENRPPPDAFLHFDVPPLLRDETPVTSASR